MTTKRLVTWITFLAIFAMATRISVDTDTWWHLRAGQWMIENGEIIKTDQFSHTRFGEAWEYPGWLVQIPMTAIFNTFGPGGLNVWVGLMVALAFTFIWRSMEGGVFFKAFILIFGATVSGVYWAARPYMVTFLLAAIFFWILEDFRAKRRDRLWWLPVLMIVWANSHGGFAVGFILLGVYFAGRLLDEAGKLYKFIRADEKGVPFKLEPETIKMILVGVVTAAAVIVNPSGPVMLLYPLKTVGIQSLQDLIAEWQSPNFHMTNVQPFAWMLLSVIGLAGVSKKGMRLEEFLLVAGFGYLSLLAGRNIALFALFAPTVMARHGSAVISQFGEFLGVELSVKLRRKVPRPQLILNGVILLLVIAAVLIKSALVFPKSENQKAFADTFPVSAVEFLRLEQPDGQLFNTYNWGAYLMWELPSYPTFVDGRTDLFNDQIIDQWLTAARGEEGWEKVLDDWDINLVFVEPGLPLVPKLESADWDLLFKDEKSVIYGR